MCDVLWMPVKWYSSGGGLRCEVSELATLSREWVALGAAWCKAEWPGQQPQISVLSTIQH